MRLCLRLWRLRLALESGFIPGRLASYQPSHGAADEAEEKGKKKRKERICSVDDVMILEG